MTGHAGTARVSLDVQDEPRMFRGRCLACGWTGPWRTTNAAADNARRHWTAKRRAESAG